MFIFCKKILPENFGKNNYSSTTDDYIAQLYWTCSNKYICIICVYYLFYFVFYKNSVLHNFSLFVYHYSYLLVMGSGSKSWVWLPKKSGFRPGFCLPVHFWVREAKVGFRSDSGTQKSDFVFSGIRTHQYYLPLL